MGKLYFEYEFFVVFECQLKSESYWTNDYHTHICLLNIFEVVSPFFFF